MERIPRPTIGFVTHSLSDEYGIALWHGVFDLIHAQGVNVICFNSEDYPTPRGTATHAKIVYNLVSARRIQGLIVSGGPLTSSMGQTGFEQFLRRQQPLPMITLTVGVSGIPNISVDNVAGIREVLRHLIEVHGYRRIAFIKGSEGNTDAEERYRAYVETLAEYGLVVNPDWVAPGQFTYQSGQHAIRLFLDERRVKIEAIVAVNDHSALGAVETLQTRGVQVPKEIAVVGFDNVNEAKASIPPLTTVQQPTYELGYAAADMLLAMIAGADVPEHRTLPTKLVVRQSCGCWDRSVILAAAGANSLNETSSEMADLLQDAMIASVVAQGLDLSKAPWIDARELIEAFVSDLQGRSSDQFLSVLKDGLLKALRMGLDVHFCHDIVSVLRQRMLPYLPDYRLVVQAEDLWHQARLVISDISRQFEKHLALKTEQHSQRLHFLGTRLISTFDVHGLTRLLAEGLPQLGIPGGYLSLYENPETPTEMVRLMLAYDERGQMPVKSSGHHFEAMDLIPTELLPAESAYSLVLITLYFEFLDEQLGFMMFKIGADYRTVRICNALRVELSSALQGALLIEAQKRAEDELRQHRDHLEELVKARNVELSKERNLLRTLIDHLPDFIYVKDVESRFLTANTALLEVMGAKTREELIGKTDFDFYPHDLAQRFYQDERALFKRGEPVLNLEEPVIHQTTGETRWLLTTKVLLRDQQNQITGLVGIGRDITEMKRAQEQLLQLKKAIETMSLGVTITNLQGQILYVNPADAAMHGYCVEELLGQNVHLFAPPDKHFTFTVDAIKHWKGLRRESVNVRKDGSSFPVWLMSEMVRNPQGEPIAIVTSCEDITDRKEAEAALHHYQEHLEELVIARTNELHEKNCQLQELNASKDKFFSIISHDLRSPFNVILGFSQLLDENLDAYAKTEIQAKVRYLRESAEQLHALLENLLTWSRIQRGVMERQPEQIHLHEIATENCLLFASKAEQKQITIANVMPEDIVAYADYHMIQTVIRNLLSNALKFTGSGNAITVSAHQNKTVVEIAVADTGIGISAEDLGKLFRIDVQHTNPGTDGERGTGLGLILCKELVEKNDGSIWVESEVGKGTTFRFTLPVSSSEDRQTTEVNV